VSTESNVTSADVLVPTDKPPTMIHWCKTHHGGDVVCGDDNQECKSFCALDLVPCDDSDLNEDGVIVVDCVVCHYMKYEVI
jgi:hypothetical protein